MSMSNLQNENKELKEQIKILENKLQVQGLDFSTFWIFTNPVFFLEYIFIFTKKLEEEKKFSGIIKNKII